MVGINKVTATRIIRPVKPSSKNQAKMKQDEPARTSDAKNKIADDEPVGMKHIDERI